MVRVSGTRTRSVRAVPITNRELSDMKKFHLLEPLAAVLTAMAAGCSPSAADIPPVENFDAGRYMGEWYEIARLPHRFERDMDFVRAEYSPNPDGTIKVVNRGMRRGELRTITGKARVKSPSANPPEGLLEVSFFGPFYSDYRIIRLDAAYRLAVVTGSTRDYLWILSRTPNISGEQLNVLLEFVRDLGFDIEKLEYPRQTPPPQLR